MLAFNRIGAIKRFIEQEGVAAALQRAFRATVGLVYRRESAYILFRSVDREPAELASLDDVNVDLLRADQIDRLGKVIYYGQNEIVRRLNEGQKCIIADHKGSILHYSWLTSKDEYAGELEKVIPVRTNERYLFNCRTLASARGRGIFPVAIARALDEAAKTGASHLITLVSTNNRSSLKAFAKMQFRIREEITMMRFLFFRKYRSRNVKNHD